MKISQEVIHVDLEFKGNEYLDLVGRASSAAMTVEEYLRMLIDKQIGSPVLGFAFYHPPKKRGPRKRVLWKLSKE